MAAHYLESHDDPGMAPPVLVLRRSDPVFLLRNLVTKSGLVKGRRGNVINIGPSGRAIQIRLAQGAEHTLPRICFKGRLNGLTFLRRQLPVRLAYAGTVHRAQGESLTRVVVDLCRMFWEHGQLYVALSRVRHPGGLMVLLPSGDGHESIQPVSDQRVVDAVLAMEEVTSS